MPSFRTLPAASVVLLSLAARAPGGTRFLDAALETASWLEHVVVVSEDGETWPSQLEGPARNGLDLYAGVPGVVLFFLEAHHLTGEDGLLRHARAGTDWLAAELERQREWVPAGLYTGVAGLGFTFCEVWKATGEGGYRDATKACVALLVERAEETEHGLRWNTSTDVISGSAGIGLFLLNAERELGSQAALTLARRAGDHLIALAIPEHGGAKWAMDPEFERRMPNFSHGTAGVAHFLALLCERTGEERYGAAAESGARYLRAIATPLEAAPEAALIFHSEPGREQLFYLGWCHGPAGTVRFFRTLERVRGDGSWGAMSKRLVGGLHASPIPRETPGFWNNVGVCCGNAGVADLLLALHRLDGGDAEAQLGLALLDDLLERSTVDGHGRRWTHAEHRVRPELLTTQTGLMQGAAGVGLVLLRAHALESGATPSIVLPDDPWWTEETTRDR